MTSGFFISQFSKGALFGHLRQGLHPTVVTGYQNGDRAELINCFGYILSGAAELRIRDGEDPVLRLTQGMYFSLGTSWNCSFEGQALIFKPQGHTPTNHFGGPIEDQGRLQYIDSCTDSLLIYPGRLGDPCLNLLVFPPLIRQTPHTHPSFRLGVVLDGDGECVMGADKVPLQAGQVFLITENTRHCFHSGPRGLKVISYHPDSDWGPTDKNHPMINRTIVE